jgi:hypothetical protein
MEKKLLKSGLMKIQFMGRETMPKAYINNLAMKLLTKLICLFYWIYLVVPFRHFLIILKRQQTHTGF